ncbi:1314_t:CDS:2 [Acaulospora colombiana]|uniref:1314_t:CDS:1 n=1 Tax=Acaulospora colombiana TaxID=27376 RepID=A0ACA9KKW0_9GLOM|nr:1314_t:CDS:2 [Acaulospora colombiana]
MFMQSTNGCQVWDTSLSVQAVIEAGLANDPENHESMIKSLEFLEDSQIESDPNYMEQCWRDFTSGLWGYSTKEQGWSVYGSTAEALKAVLYLQAKLDYTPPLVYQSQIHSAIDVLIEKQHPNGGYSNYELVRGQSWLDSVMTCLRIFSKVDLVDYRVDEIEKVINKATNYIHNTQRKDGSWFGSWGICFTYATMFALQGLSSVGENYENSKYVKKACDFLISKQCEDGGWGESYKSAAGSGKYIQSQGSQVVNTAWALLGLMYAQYPVHDPVKRGIDVCAMISTLSRIFFQLLTVTLSKQLIISRQTHIGEWKQESFEGIVGKNCPINYSNYKFIFTIRALGLYSKLYESDGEDDGLWEFI